ncbi:MAG: hypothetical protein K0U98_21885 [Deltaproteobacteria bacterium]|nr:hypothetical protein [Deltaproteobacteria bacterium]
MRRTLSFLLCLFAGIVLLSPIGCGSDTAQVDELAVARDAALAELRGAKQALDEKRAQLGELQAKLTAPEPEEGEEEAVEPIDPEAVKAEIATLKAHIENDADTLGGSIVTFINEDPPVSGEPLSETQQAAIDMKVDEDILLAQEWIQVGGDYKRAISILEQILPLAPDHPRLKEEIERADTFRYMTEERFESAKKGLSEEEVRELLGPVNLRNVREYPDKGVIAWFYPKDGGGAAGVYFRKKSGAFAVYKTDFNAVKVEEQAQ